MNTKDATLDRFGSFRAMIDNLGPQKIKILATYRGGGYTSKKL